MPLVRLIDLSFSYRDSVPILSGVSIQFVRGWTGIVGPNGAGKSTLMRLIAGELKPERGHVKFEPSGAAVRMCPQTAEALTDEVETFARATDRGSRRIHGELRLDPRDLSRWPTMSAGERKRWQVGAALAAEPDVLMLDEPTDHLDADARDFLIAALSGFAGVGIIASHDRALLNVLTSYTLRFHEGNLRLWRGSYETARQSWEREAHEHHEAFEKIKREERTLARRLADKRRMAATAEAQKRRENRRRGLFDGQVGAPARTIAGRVRQDITVLRRKVARVSQERAGFHFEKPPGRSVFVDYIPAPASRLLSLDLEELRAGDKRILEDVHVAVMRESRIRIAGPNGIGKSTLLRALLLHSRIPPARLLYLPQELHADEAAAMLDSARDLAGKDRDRVLTLIAALGVEPERLLESQSPSPGEARKLKLAYGLGRQVWGLILDEPTNHLDMPAIERLEEALRGYPGALVMVTHDELLARRCTNTEWRLIEGRIDMYSDWAESGS